MALMQGMCGRGTVYTCTCSIHVSTCVITTMCHRVVSVDVCMYMYVGVCVYVYEWWCVFALSAILEICTGKWPVASCYFGSGVTHVHCTCTCGHVACGH